MRKLEGRALLCLVLALVLIIGLGIFIGKLMKDGEKWASFYANVHVYNQGHLAVGAVYDRNGVLLLENDSQGSHYNEDSAIRKATLHVVGDKGENIATAVNHAMKGKIIGYNPVTGTKGVAFDSGRKLKLTIDAETCKAAYEALGYRDGFVGVYNWKTGEILCMVSKPGFDPAKSDTEENVREGAYINKVISTTATPGSTFKLVTTAAALEHIDNINQRTFTCTGSYEIEGEKITCPEVHGTMDIYGMLANSCNCAYASMTVEMGSEVMEETVDRLGLTSSHSIDGIESRKGTFNFDTYNINLGWAGIGQFEDQVNPLSLMVYMGAIAGEGNASKPRILLDGQEDSTTFLSAETAAQIKDMMRNNVLSKYGDSNYPGLELHAKSGTAEGAEGTTPDAWMCGFSGEYAFVVCIENGGYGSSVAGPVVNRVLQTLQQGN